MIPRGSGGHAKGGRRHWEGAAEKAFHGTPRWIPLFPVGKPFGGENLCEIESDANVCQDAALLNLSARSNPTVNLGFDFRARQVFNPANASFQASRAALAVHLPEAALIRHQALHHWHP